jgi:hypothetical protein
LLGGHFLNAGQLVNLMGWTVVSIMALCCLILIYGAAVDAINAWRWKRACKRGEVKFHPERQQASYR